MVFSALSCSTANASVSDLSVEITPNGPSYLAPGAVRDIEVIIRNHGPDPTRSVAAVTSSFFTTPIGEVDLVQPPSANACQLMYTDLTIPPNQEVLFASFAPPNIGVDSEFRCSIRVIALARGVRSYTLAISSRDVAPDAFDPVLENNIGRFTFSFAPPAVPLTFHPSIALVIIVGIGIITWIRTK